jgi:hypothetical protein
MMIRSLSVVCLVAALAACTAMPQSESNLRSRTGSRNSRRRRRPWPKCPHYFAGIGRLSASRLSHGYYVELPQVGHKVIAQSVCGQQIAALFFDHPESSPVLPCIREKPHRLW